MLKLIFVCLGNICRSPMAEYICRARLEEAGLSGRVSVSSAGTSGEEEGNPVYPPARAELSAMGISCAGKRARRSQNLYRGHAWAGRIDRMRPALFS